MQYIELVNFIDLCSDSFIELLDNHYNDFETENGKVFIDFSRNSICKHYYHIIVKNFLKSRSYGKKYILINTCKPSKNWRKQTNENGKFPYHKCISIDSEIVLDFAKLETTIEKNWEILKKSLSTVIFVENSNLDYTDIESILIDLIGKNWLTFKHPKYLMFKDGNIVYIRSTDEIPKHLYDNIKTQLFDKGIIA